MTSIIRSRAEAELESYAFDPSCVLFLPLYRLDGDSFASKDKYGRACVNHGSVWTPQGRKFDISDKTYIAITNGVVVTSAATIEIWTRRTSLVDGYLLCRDAAGGSNTQYSYILNFIDHEINWNLGDGIGGAQHEAGSTVLDDTGLHHIAWTWDSSYSRLFIDGVEDPSSPWAQTTVPNDNGRATHIGRARIGYDGGYYEGIIKAILMYSRILTPQEISRHAVVAKEVFG